MTHAITEPMTQPVHWDLRYDVHLGATWSKFMEGLRNKQILANRCTTCVRVFVPPQAYCESCFEPTGEWLQLAPEGTVEVFTVAWLGFKGGPKPPYVIGGIRLDGASTLLMHRISGVDLSDPARVHDELPLGSQVRAVWSDDRTGQILDIEHFEPCR